MKNKYYKKEVYVCGYYFANEKKIASVFFISISFMHFFTSATPEKKVYTKSLKTYFL